MTIDPAQSVQHRFEHANLLAASARPEEVEEAKSLYLAVIDAEPEHLGAWNNLGTLLFDSGYTSAAQTAFTAAVSYHPREAAAHVNLGQVLLYRNELPAAQQHFEIALELDPDLAAAHQGLASIFHRQGDEDKAAWQRRLGYGSQPLSSLSYRGSGEPIRLLILASSLEGNIPWRFLLDREVFDSTIVVVEYFAASLPLPEHQLIFNAIGDADQCHEALEIAARLSEKSTSPVINRPAAVLESGRLANSRRLAAPGKAIAPKMEMMAKTVLLGPQAWEILAQRGFAFPLLLRSPGHHGGNYFVRIDRPEQLPGAIAELPGEKLLLIEYLDSRSQDGLFRKYRVMSIGGVLYPLHMAVSSQWKVHYFSSEMEQNEQFRREEALFLGDFAVFLGREALAALEKISAALALDYCGIDFGIDKNGKVLLFEANATMVINPPTQEAQWDYRRAPIEKALAACKRMFVERSSA